MTSKHDAAEWPPDLLSVDLNSPEWLTPAQAAHVARVSEKTIRQWARDRGIALWTPAGRCWINRRRLFSVEPPEMG